MEQSHDSTRPQHALAARLHKHWQPVVRSVVAACGGDSKAAAQIEPLMSFLSQKEEWNQLSQVLRRIMGGERDPALLLQGLDSTDSLIAGNVLHGLGVDPSPMVPDFISFVDLPQDRPHEFELELYDFLEGVIHSTRPDIPPELRTQLHNMAYDMVADDDTPDEMRGLSQALRDLLGHHVTPDLSLVKPDLAHLLQGMGMRTWAKSKEPGQA